MRSAKGFWPPAASQARRNGSLDMPEQYPFFGQLQPKNLCKTAKLKFGSPFHMKPIDSVAFGRRVHELREDLGLSQRQLWAAAGHSASNIGWIEQGGVQKPQRLANELAVALQTTREWLLWKEGPKHIGPRYLASPKLVEKYEILPPEAKAEISQVIEKAAEKASRKKLTG
jgi:transcriptional regulator with XRE-family HTH domain